jgi:hypothetical protein
MGDYPTREELCEAEQIFHDEVHAACTKLSAVQFEDLPVQIVDDPTVAQHACTVHLLLPLGVPVTQEIVDEACRLSDKAKAAGWGWGCIVKPNPTTGTSTLHDAAAANGLDVSKPCVFVEEVINEFVFSLLATYDLKGPADPVLSEDWQECGVKLLDPLGVNPSSILRTLIMLDGEAEVRLLEDGVEIGIGTTSKTTGSELREVDFPSLSESPHAYRAQIRGKGTVEAMSLLVMSRNTQRRFS